MFKNLAATTLAFGLFSTSALADGKIYVQLPDMTSYTGAAAEEMLRDLVFAGIAAANCTDYGITDEEWSLMTDASDLLAYGQLKLDLDTYDSEYYMPGFAALEEPGACETWGAKVQPLIDELVSHGGSREALPDQDKAYEEWRVLMDRLQAEASNPDAAPGGDAPSDADDSSTSASGKDKDKS